MVFISKRLKRKPMVMVVAGVEFDLEEKAIEDKNGTIIGFNLTLDFKNK